MMKKFYLSVIVILLVSLSGVAVAEENIAADIQALVEENVQATQAEDAQAMMKTIHTQSPNYALTEQQTVPIFQAYDLSYTIDSFSYIGVDGDYALARVTQTTKKISGPDFQDNELDLIQVFRKESGKWKYWTQAVLDVKYLNQ